MIRGPILRWPEARGAEKATCSVILSFATPGWSWRGAKKLEKYVFQAFLIFPRPPDQSGHPFLYPLPKDFAPSSLWVDHILLYLASLDKTCTKECAEHFTLIVAFNHPKNPTSGYCLLLFYILPLLRLRYLLKLPKLLSGGARI